MRETFGTLNSPIIMVMSCIEELDSEPALYATLQAYLLSGMTDLYVDDTVSAGTKHFEKWTAVKSRYENATTADFQRRRRAGATILQKSDYRPDYRQSKKICAQCRFLNLTPRLLNTYIEGWQWLRWCAHSSRYCLPGHTSFTSYRTAAVRKPAR